MSLWSTAPFLQNNTVGPFESSPSVEARMESFKESIEQMLWPERRDKDQTCSATSAAPASASSIGMTVEQLSRGAERLHARRSCAAARIGPRLFPLLGGEASVTIGPFPKGMPVGLLTNIGPDRRRPDRPGAARRTSKRLLQLLKHAKRELKAQAGLRDQRSRARRRHARASASAATSSSTRATTSAPATSPTNRA